ncbi:MAG: hypothetical protein JNG88_14135 [Phycisphaerales bacterium]|nr:hypothetical protein [Phycisphaerales bacterium]
MLLGSFCRGLTAHRRRAHVRVMLALSVAGIAAIGAFQAWIRQTDACGGTPPPPVCGITLSLSKGVPGVIVVPPGPVTIGIPTTVFFNLIASPPGSGACPPPPYMCTTSLTLACAPPPGTAGTAGPIPIMPGANPIIVPVVIPPGPPRVCTVTGTSTVTLTNGQTATAAGDTEVCIVRAAPQDPSLPELDLQVIGDNAPRIHPGDVACIVVCVRNYHPTMSMSGVLSADGQNSSRMPTQTGAPPGAGVYATSDPDPNRMTDNPSMAWIDQTDDCVPEPVDPHAPVIPNISRSVVLAPGETRYYIVNVRPSSMCADGSCNEHRIRFNGSRSDGATVLGCAGAMVIVDTTVPPSYACNNSGAATCLEPVAGGRLVQSGQPYPRLPDGSTLLWNVMTNISPLQLFAPGPIPVQTQHSSELLTNEMRPTCDYARQQSLVFRLDGQPLFAPTSFFDVFFELDFTPDPLHSMTLHPWTPTPNAPTGFANRAPMSMAMADMHRLAPPMVDSFFDIFHQVSLDGLTSTGISVPIEIVMLEILPVGANTGRLHIRGRSTNPGAGPVVALTMYNDWRGFARGAGGQPLGACCLIDHTCAISTERSCAACGGIWQGAGTTCNPNPCLPVVTETRCTIADINGDGRIDNFDIDPFVEVIVGANTDPDYVCSSDINGDCVVNNFDIDAFVGAVVIGGIGIRFPLCDRECDSTSQRTIWRAAPAAPVTITVCAQSAAGVDSQCPVRVQIENGGVVVDADTIAEGDCLTFTAGAATKVKVWCETSADRICRISYSTP